MLLGSEKAKETFEVTKAGKYAHFFEKNILSSMNIPSRRLRVPHKRRATKKNSCLGQCQTHGISSQTRKPTSSLLQFVAPVRTCSINKTKFLLNAALETKIGVWEVDFAIFPGF